MHQFLFLSDRDWLEIAAQCQFRPNELADYCDCSMRSLERLFEMRFDGPPKTTLLSWQLALARRLLRPPESKPTKVVAAEGCFSSEAYFCFAFKKKMGVTPQEYAQHERHAMLLGRSSASSSPSAHPRS